MAGQKDAVAVWDVQTIFIGELHVWFQHSEHPERQNGRMKLRKEKLFIT